ncbi:uncharacterized protein LOC128983032 [Macrosteles quadrilineatus]|uniref:uncharacterized protein LOC128983032 n=1 Tax=Macrosteles quadrilineatus TaxID=74068 RepID=UPI0023E0C55C|nr:uncharacterized protein LOC128983032 [Macrosteles quadrilineatus]
MAQLFSRLKAKLKELYYDSPLPNLIKKLEPKTLPDTKLTLCKRTFPNNDLNDLNLPDDFRDIKLEKTNVVYHLKLKNIAPYQWMQVGTKLLNMAYEDPDYDKDPEDDGLYMDPLPPPPEPTEYIKSLKGPLISLHLKNLAWPALEEIGEMFYDLGWIHRKEYDPDDYDALPDMWDRFDQFPESDAEEMEEGIFNPLQRVNEEMTEVKRLTNSDVLPGIPKIPWKDDAETWLDSPHQDSPPWNDVPEEDFKSPGKIYPLQSTALHPQSSEVYTL